MRLGLLASENSLLLASFLRVLEGGQDTVSAVFIDGAIPQRMFDIAIGRLEPGFSVPPLTEMPFHSTPVYFVDHNSRECVELVKSLKIDFLINAGTPKILKEPTLEASGGVLNCHPGLLPQYRGCTCVEWSIYNGDPVGATAHLMEREIDRGPILALESMAVEAFQSYRSIRTRMIDHQAKVLKLALDRITAAGGSISEAQLSIGAEGTYHKPIPDDKLKIVFEKIESGNYSCA